MSLQAKIQKVTSLLPPNKQIFMTFALFQTVQQVPESTKSKFFDQNISQIAKMCVEAIYTQKDIDQIDQMELIGDLEEWLSNSGVKFQLQKKPQPKIQKIERKPQPVQQRAPEQQPNRIYNQQANLSPKPQRRQMQQYATHTITPGQTYHATQTHPQSYYQNLPVQGRPTGVKYPQRQPQTSYPTSNQHLQIQQLQLQKRQQHEKQHFGWIDNLSKCLTYPQRRFYILPQMHPRRKF